MKVVMPRRQGGFAMLTFVIVVSALALSLVAGYSSLFARKQLNQVADIQRTYLDEARAQVLSTYRKLSTDPAASPSADLTYTQYAGGTDVWSWTRQPQKWGAQAIISNRLVTSEGLYYRKVALWIPTETDAGNPPAVAKFVTTGVFDSCTTSGAACDTRQFLVVDTQDIEKELFARSTARLTNIVQKSQAYFKARLLQDPERNVSVNYFRDPYGSCTKLPNDIGCINSYTALSAIDIGATLNLSPEEQVNAWGGAVTVVNAGPDAETTDAPFSISFQTCLPYGGKCVRMLAVQQL